MFCNHCGAQLPEGASFCRACGHAVSATTTPASEAPTGEYTAPSSVAPNAAAGTYVPPAEPPTDPKALGSLISGIVGLTFIPILASIVAIVLGHLGLSDIKKSAGRLKGRGMAIAGLVMGYLGVAFIPIILIIAAIAIPNLLRARIAANEASAIGSVRTISTAQTSYASQHPDRGFTCSLGDLGPRFGVGASDDAADLINSQLASGTRSGYNFTLRDCESDTSDGPVIRYKVVATPVTRNTSGNRTFCSDESGVIRFVHESSGEACLSDGVPID